MLRRSRSEKLITLGAFLRARCKHLHAAFAAFDVQNTGRVEFEAFERGLSRLGFKEHAFLMWPLLDPNQAGYVSLENFLAALGEHSDALDVGSVPCIPEQDVISSKQVSIRPWEDSLQRAPETDSSDVGKDDLHELRSMLLDVEHEENPELTTQSQNSSGVKAFDGSLVMDGRASNRSHGIAPNVATETDTLATLVTTIEVLEAQISCLRADMESARIEWRAELKEAVSEERNRTNTQHMNLAQRGNDRAFCSLAHKATSASSTDSGETVAASSSEAATREFTQRLTHLEARVDSLIAEGKKQHLQIELLEADTKMEIEDLRGKLHCTGACHDAMEKIRSEVGEGFRRMRMQTQDDILSTSKELVKQFELRVLTVVQRMVSTVKCGESRQNPHPIRQRSASPAKPSAPIMGQQSASLLDGLPAKPSEPVRRQQSASPLDVSRLSLSRSMPACAPLGKATVVRMPSFGMSPRMSPRLSSEPAVGRTFALSTPHAQVAKPTVESPIAPVHIATLR